MHVSRSRKQQQQLQHSCRLLLRQYASTSIYTSTSSSTTCSNPDAEVRYETHHHFNEPIERLVNIFTGERQENDELMQNTVEIEDHHHFREKIVRTKQSPPPPSTSSSRKPLLEMDSEAQLAALKTMHQEMIMNSINYIPQKKKSLEKLARRNPSRMDFYEDDINAVNEGGGLYIRQCHSEEQQYLDAVQEQLEMRDNMIDMGKAPSLSYVHRRLLSWYQPLVNSIDKEVREIGKFGVGVAEKVPDRKVYGPYLLLLSNEKLATITLDSVMSNIVKDLSRPVPLLELTRRIGDLIEIEINIQRFQEGKTKLRKWEEELINQVSNVSASRRYAYEKIKRVINEPYTTWDQATKVKIGARLVQLLTEEAKTEKGTPVFLHKRYYSPMMGKQMGVIELIPEMSMALANDGAVFVIPAYLPMLVKPKPWNNQLGIGGYFRLRSTIVKSQSQLQQRAVKKANMPQILDALDFLGQTPWRINKFILDVAKEIWATGGNVASIPTRKDLEMMSEDEFYEKLAQEESEEKVQREAREKEAPSSSSNTDSKYSVKNEEWYIESVRRKKYRDQCERVKRINANLHSLRCDFEIKMNVAEQFKDEKMYFPMHMDYRGRVYPIPPHLSHIGADLPRALLVFDKKKPLGEEGYKWLKIHLCNLFGANKISLEDRLKFVDENMDNIRDSVERPLKGKRWWLTAENPFQALSACHEIMNAINSGNPETYLSCLPVHQDGSCNGLQHYAALGKDTPGAVAVNLTKTDLPQDVYSAVLNIVISKVEADAALPEDYREEVNEGEDEGTPKRKSKRSKEDSEYEEMFTDGEVDMFSGDPFLDDDGDEEDFRGAMMLTRRDHAILLNGKIDRKVIKQTVMTSVYGVTLIGAREQIKARLMEVFFPEIKSALIDHELERRVYAAAGYLAKKTLESLSEMFSSANDIKTWLSVCAFLIAQKGHPVSWITPLGLPCVQPYRKHNEYIVKTTMQAMKLADNDDYLPISSNKQRSAFPPNFVHSLDATHMFLTALAARRDGLTFAAVHDSFWTHACDIPTLSSSLREEFIVLYQSPVLESLAESLDRRFPDIVFPEIPARGDFNVEEVRDSVYFFH